MAKRFTDTDKWKVPFIRGLDAKYKLLWLYILDDCDHAGIWIVDLEIAGIRCGFTYDEKDVEKNLGPQIEKIKGGSRWFIRDFIDFQYGKLNPENRAHNSALSILSKYNIKPLTRSLQGRKDKDTDKDKEERAHEISHPLLLWIKDNCKRVSQLQNPLTEKEADRLIEDFDKRYISHQLLAMENWKSLTKNNASVNLTFRNWAAREDDYENWKKKHPSAPTGTKHPEAQ